MRLLNYFRNTAGKIAVYCELAGIPMKRKMVLLQDNKIIHRIVEVQCADTHDAFPIEVPTDIATLSALDLKKAANEAIEKINFSSETTLQYIAKALSEKYPTHFKNAQPLPDKNIRDANAALVRLMAQTTQSFAKLLRDQSATVAKQAVEDFVNNAVQANVLDKLNTSNIYTGRLPRHTYSYRKVGKTEKFVLEVPPGVKTIRVANVLGNQFGSTSGGNFEIAFPFIIFVVTLVSGKFQKAQVFMRSTPMSDKDEKLYYPLFSNIFTTKDKSYQHHSCEICTGNDVVNRSTSVETVNTMIEMFWASQFNADLAPEFVSTMSRTSIKSFEDWQEKTSKSRGFILKEKLVDYGYSLDQILHVEGENEVDQTEALKQLKKNLIENSGSIVSDLQILFGSFRPALDPQVKDEFVKQLSEIVNNVYKVAEQVAAKVANEEELKNISLTAIKDQVDTQVLDVFQNFLTSLMSSETNQIEL